MLGLLARLVGGALDPLIDRASDVAARLARKLALFLVAAVCMLVVLIALTVAFDLWVASKFGSIVGALAVAGVYLTVAVVAVVLALRPASKPAPAAQTTADAERAQSSTRKAQVDAFSAPLMRALAGLGLRREQLAVLAGSSIAKQLGPLPLVGLAILGGFLLGRMWKSWRSLLSTDALASVIAAVGLFGAGDESEDEDEAAEEENEAA